MRIKLSLEVLLGQQQQVRDLRRDLVPKSSKLLAVERVGILTTLRSHDLPSVDCKRYFGE